MVNAHEGVSLPIIDPAQVFAPGVEVVETLPVLTYDNQNRLVWYFDPGQSQWEEYTYPQELDEIQEVQQRTDGSFLLSNLWYEGLAGAITENIWLFDPIAEKISRPQTVCNLVQALPGEGEWHFTQLEDGLYRLCNTETGEYSDPLPDDLQSKVKKVCIAYPSHGKGVPSTSPDGNWVVFHTCRQIFADKPPIDYIFYAYQTAAKEFHQLGTVTPYLEEYVAITEWVDNTHVLLRTGNFRTSSSHTVAIADVEKINSINEIADQYAYFPQYFANPPRLYWVSGKGIDNIEQTIYRYDFVSGIPQVFAKRRCGVVECEAAYVAQADDKIVVLVGGYPLAVSELYPSIWDAQTGQLLYETQSGRMGLQRLDEQTFLTDTFDIEVNDVVAKILVIQDHRVIETIHREVSLCFGSDMYASPSGQYILIPNCDGHTDIYDFVAQERYVVVPEFADDYCYSFEWYGEYELQVSVSEKIESCGHANPIRGIWLVRVPGTVE